MKFSHVPSIRSRSNSTGQPISAGQSNNGTGLDWLLAVLFEAVWRQWRIHRLLEDAECIELDRLLDAPRGTSRLIADRLSSDVRLVADLERHCSPAIPEHMRLGSRKSRLT